MVLCDTNIFIHAFNGSSQTLHALDQIGFANILISSISVMELYQGMGNKNELQKMKENIQYYDIVEVDLQTSKLARELLEKFNLSHGLLIPDAIIGACSIVHQIELFTYNVKDFRFMPGISLHQIT